MPKHKKDPNRPKRALTGFMFFSKEQRQRVLDENPDIGFGDIGKKLGEEWRRLASHEKEPYEKRAQEDKLRYKTQMKTYKPDPSYTTRGKRKDPNKPKRAMSAYLYFCDSMRDSLKAEYPEKQMTEIQKILGTRWGETTPAEKVPYQKQAEADRKRYEQEVLRLAEEKNKRGEVIEGEDDGNDDDDEDEVESD